VLFLKRISMKFDNRPRSQFELAMFVLAGMLMGLLVTVWVMVNVKENVSPQHSDEFVATVARFEHFERELNALNNSVTVLHDQLWNVVNYANEPSVSGLHRHSEIVVNPAVRRHTDPQDSDHMAEQS
jgi:hypothetical protein